MQHDRSSASTQMAREIAEIPDKIARQLREHGPAYEDAGRRLRALAPRALVTVARGSSDCAAAFLKHLIEARLRIPVTSVSPSLASIYSRNLCLPNAVSWAISQSGASDDINLLQCANRTAGALTISLVNQPGSRIESHSDLVLPMGAGPELAVPATKSFACSLVAITAVVAAWVQDAELAASLMELPVLIDRSFDCNWEHHVDRFAQADSAIILGRGPGLAIAQEAALKLKETSYIFAEAFSAAEIWHGPAALMTPTRPVMIFAQADESFEGSMATIQKARRLGASVSVVASRDTGSERLDIPPAADSIIETVTMICCFYKFAEHLARVRGTDVDAPRGLQKVTMTV